MFNSHHSRELLICSLNDNLEAQVQLHFKNAFVDFALSGQERIQTQCGEIPSEFSYHRLGEYVSFAQGTQVPVEEQFLESELEPDQRVRFIRIVDYTTNQRETPRYIKISPKQCLCNENDVTMVRYGNVGLVGRRISGVIANNIFKIIPLAPLTNEFLFYFLKQPSIYEFIVASCGGSAMPSIKHSTIAELDFALPPKQLIDGFSQIASQAEKVILSNLKEIVLLQNEKNCLLSALITQH